MAPGENEFDTTALALVVKNKQNKTSLVALKVT